MCPGSSRRWSHPPRTPRAGDVISLVRDAGRSEPELAALLEDSRRRGDLTRVRVPSSWPPGVLRTSLDVPSAVDVYAALCNIDVYAVLTAGDGLGARDTFGPPLLWSLVR
ncbi:hypothetical protein ABZ214_17445 [Streptomyces iakyrus]|uniref:hypothetical protein n=1 Tax=Streptomyces iakyrus TaxID=68219 RepID=UPI0033BD56D0